MIWLLTKQTTCYQELGVPTLGRDSVRSRPSKVIVFLCQDTPSEEAGLKIGHVCLGIVILCLSFLSIHLLDMKPFIVLHNTQ
jgi:hypothetical protein